MGKTSWISDSAHNFRLGQDGTSGFENTGRGLILWMSIKSTTEKTQIKAHGLQALSIPRRQRMPQPSNYLLAEGNFFPKVLQDQHTLRTSTTGLRVWTAGEERLKRSRGPRGSTGRPQKVSGKSQLTGHRLEQTVPSCTVRAWKWVGTRSVCLREECFWGRLRVFLGEIWSPLETSQKREEGNETGNFRNQQKQKEARYASAPSTLPT